MRVRVLGVGMGPQHVTAEVAVALAEADYVLAAEKSADDPLLAARRELARHFGDRPVVVVPDPFLVWGDPSLYDSTLRILEQIAARGIVAVEYDVLPGISAPQLLAARHRIVLHRVGEPVHVTTRRRLAGAVTAGESNIVVMLTGELDLDGFEDWSIWWGANLGADGEELVTGRVGEVLPQILAARARAKAVTGWVMDAYLLRRDR
jgi:precorrin-6A synthase